MFRFFILLMPIISTFLQLDAQDIYQFKVTALDGSVIDFSAFKGRKIIIVNTASKCGYTPQYEGLEELYKKNKDKLVIIGFPSDNFGGQEFSNNSEIQEFCTKNYGITFPLTTRVDVKGESIHPVFKFLTQKKENGVLDADIKWNFSKFLIDEKGKLVAFYGSKVKPEADEIRKWVEE